MGNPILKNLGSLLSAALLCLLPTSASIGAENISITVSGPATPVTVGSPVSFWLNALNTSTQEMSWSFSQDIQCRLMSQPPSTLDVVAGLRDRTRNGLVTIAPGTFERREYTLKLPESESGQIWIEIPGFPTIRLVLDVRNAPPPVAEQLAPPKKGVVFFLGGRKQGQADALYDPDDFFKEHIFGYEPLYFLVGTKSPNAKFQISFKYRLLNDHGWLAQEAPWLTGLHLAYSQTSLWDWNGPSAPFFDSSYKPEFLYSWQRLVGGAPTNWFQFDIQGGLQHESNGKDGADSRSINIAYLRPTFVFGKDSGPQLSLIPRVWTYLGDVSDNPDIADYRGYTDLKAALGWKRGLQVSALGRMGKDANHGSVQVDVTYPLMQPPNGSFSIYLHAQYFTGYGESILRYNQKSEVFRAGISLYR